jgi:hypothetical protein
MPTKTNGLGESNALIQRRADNERALHEFDCEAKRREIAACNSPDKVEAILHHIKLLQQTCSRLFDNNEEVRAKLYDLELQARCRLLELIERLKKSSGPGRGKRIRKPGKLSALNAAGMKRSTAYDYRNLLKVSSADRDRYVANCRTEHRTPTINGLLNDWRKRQKLKRNLRSRPWTDDRDGLFGCDVVVGEPSPAASAYEMTRLFSVEDRMVHVACVLTDLSERERRLFGCNDEALLFDFVQRRYELRERPDQFKRFIADLMQEVDTSCDTAS